MNNALTKNELVACRPDSHAPFTAQSLDLDEMAHHKPTHGNEAVVGTSLGAGVDNIDLSDQQPAKVNSLCQPEPQEHAKVILSLTEPAAMPNLMVPSTPASATTRRERLRPPSGLSPKRENDPPSIDTCPGAVAVDGCSPFRQLSEVRGEESSEILLNSGLDLPLSRQEFSSEEFSYARDRQERISGRSTEDLAELGEPVAVAVSTEDMEREVRARILQEAVYASSVENVSVATTENDSDGGPGDYVSKPSARRSHCSWSVLLLFLLMLLGALAGGIAGISSALSNKQPSESLAPSSAPTTSEHLDEEELLHFLIHFSLDNGASLNDPGSPQSLAYAYLLESRMHGDDRTFDRDLLQLYSLATFYFSTNGPTAWANRSGWLASPDVDHPCTWHGVFCTRHETKHNGTRRLQSVRPNFRPWKHERESRLLVDATTNLTNSSTTDTQSGDVANLLALFQGLESLPLSYSVIGLMLRENGLDGFGPPELTLLSSLLTLDVSGNNFNGQILPLNVVLFKDLQVVNVSNSRFAGTMVSLGFLAPTLSHLEVVDISGNNISGPLTPDFGEMPSLRILIADDNPFMTGSVPDSTCDLANITQITVDCERISCACCTPHCAKNRS
jgi:hypothetical protein